MFNNSERGVSLIITFFIMIIILAVVLSISVLLYSEVKVIRNIGNSMVSLYAADSGIEKVLYYDRQVLPNNGNVCSSDPDCTSSPYTSCKNRLCTIPLSRGLCSIFALDNPKHCVSGSTGDTSIYCNSFNPSPPDCPTPLTPGGDHCSSTACTNCTICFATTFDGRTYYTTAKVYPDIDGTSSDFEVDSKGVFGGTARKIQILITTAP